MTETYIVLGLILIWWIYPRTTTVLFVLFILFIGFAANAQTAFVEDQEHDSKILLLNGLVYKAPAQQDVVAETQYGDVVINYHSTANVGDRPGDTFEIMSWPEGTTVYPFSGYIEETDRAIITVQPYTGM